LHEIGNSTFKLVRRVTNTKLAKIGKLTTKFSKEVGNNQLSL